MQTLPLWSFSNALRDYLLLRRALEGSAPCLLLSPGGVFAHRPEGLSAPSLLPPSLTPLGAGPVYQAPHVEQLDEETSIDQVGGRRPQLMPPPSPLCRTHLPNHPGGVEYLLPVPTSYAYASRLARPLASSSSSSSSSSSRACPLLSVVPPWSGGVAAAASSSPLVRICVGCLHFQTGPSARVFLPGNGLRRRLHGSTKKCSEPSSGKGGQCTCC